MEIIQVPSSKIGGGGDDLKTAAWNGLNRHNGHFDIKFRKMTKEPLGTKDQWTKKICSNLYIKPFLQNGKKYT